MFKSLANAIRFLAIDQVGQANSGHLGSSLGISDCLTVLFKNFLVFDPENPFWPNRDRFVLSGGHNSAALYAVLHLVGYDNISINELKNFRCLGSKTSGHPEYDIQSGIEISTGPLGQGVANAVGMALEERLLNARLGDDCINHYTYVIAGEGDLMEGVAHEACSLAGTLKLGHLVLLHDRNNITIDGSTNVSCKDDISKQFEAYHWHIQEVNGHDERALSAAIEEAKQDDRPSIIICNTKIGYGTPREGLPSAHSGALTKEEREFACKYFGWDSAPFEVPEYIQHLWRILGKRNHELCEAWYQKQFDSYQKLNENDYANAQSVFRKIKKDYFINRPFIATRTSFKNILNELIKASSTLISGSCDLGGSTGCRTADMTPIIGEDSKINFAGNYIHYGVREHAMGAILNGMTAGGKIRCCGGTFLAFSDYMRPAIRMSALMDIPSIFVFSHDSIGVGEDGPTHQPVEQLAALRAMPNLQVFRPADAMETVECWELALQSRHPSAIILTRQSVLSVRYSGNTNLCETGAYLLNDDELNHRFTIIASGSEVGIALELKKKLNDHGVFGNVVSFPCWKLFDEQSQEFKDTVLGKNCLRIGIEASNGFGWEKYLGEHGKFFGVQHFGVSCPAQEAFAYFKLTATDIFNKVIEEFIN
ncbi:MAG: transketolase [Alphaproteobacteria bacterium]|nr:transketolase [Alphaproteobacteria bacterium]